MKVVTEFNEAEMDLLREWYNALRDVAPKYLEEKDHELGRKIVQIVKDTAQRRAPRTSAR